MRRPRLPAFFAPGGIPLAWRQLAMEPRRFSAALAGILFGTLLMLFQYCLYGAFMEMVVFPLRALRGDLVIVSRNYDYFYSSEPFTLRRLHQARAHAGVARVFPLSTVVAMWRNPATGRSKELGVLVIDPAANPFRLGAVARQAPALANPENVLFDRASDAEYGPVAGWWARDGTVAGELAHRRVQVAGLFTMGATLAYVGHVIIGDRGWQRIDPGRAAGAINVGVVELAPGAAPRQVAEQLRAALPDDVEVITPAEFARREQVYWRDSTPIGFITLAGMLVGLLVGSLVAYQVLFTDISDHLREYATLKAIGMDQRFFVRLVFAEVAILQTCSFVPAALLTELLNALGRAFGGLPTRLTPSAVMLVFALSAGMCVASGLLALKKLRKADPAEVF